MPVHDEGSGPHERIIPTAAVTRFTPGKRAALNKSPLLGPGGKMCDVDGEACEFIINDTIPAGVDGWAFGALKPESGAIAARALAGGPVTAGHDLCVKISATDGLPKLIDVDDAEGDDWIIVANARMGHGATEEDVADSNGVFFPSLTVYVYPPNRQRAVGTAGVLQQVPVTFELAEVADGDLYTFTPGFVGEIRSDEFSVSEAVTTAAKAATFSLKINGVAVTGGAIVVTSALATPAGANIPGSAVTALNTFDANDEITITASDVTAFVEGRGDVVITLRQTPAV